MLRKAIPTLLVVLAVVFCCAGPLILAAGGLGFLTGLLTKKATLAALGLLVIVGVAYILHKQDISVK